MPWVLLGAAGVTAVWAWLVRKDTPTLLHPGEHKFRFSGSTPQNLLSLNITFGAGNVHDLGGGLYSVNVLTEKQVILSTIPGAAMVA